MCSSDLPENSAMARRYCLIMQSIVGHLGTTLVDPGRAGRSLAFDMWFPATGSGPSSVYTLLPGIDLPSTNSVESTTAKDGTYPLIVWSHGRTGQRHNYTQLCEGLAARGFVVASADHPGDTLTDWLTGANVDDETNERQRLGDVKFLLDSLLASNDLLPTSITRVIDAERVHVGGHSYGGLTAIISTTGMHGLPGDTRIRSIAGAQAYTRTLPSSVIDAISIPVLLLVGNGDVTTPPATDADPIWAAIRNRDARHKRVDLPLAGHQGCSDFALYMELVPSIPGVPTLVLDYLTSIAAESPAGFTESWREILATQIDAIEGFFRGS